MLFGKKIRELRDENGVLQRQLAALLEIDTPMFSKIERGDRRAKREQVIKLAEYFHQDENEMLTLWLADKVLDAVDGEQEAYELLFCIIAYNTQSRLKSSDDVSDDENAKENLVKVSGNPILPMWYRKNVNLHTFTVL